MASSLLAVLLLLFASTAAQSQEKTDFGRLRAERQQTLADLDSAKTKLRDADDEARRISASAKAIESFIERNKSAIEDARKRLESAKAAKAPVDSLNRLQRDVVDLEASTERAVRDLEEKVRTTKTVEELRETIRLAERRLADTETQINELLARDVVAQNFKSEISAYFAGVVALMIVGFFGIAFYDPVVRNNIFSGQSGIQFVTLFSIIISIILFGITGILGDKELSALLGGLSGYILGKYGNGEGSNGPRSTLSTVQARSGLPAAGGNTTSEERAK